MSKETGDRQEILDFANMVFSMSAGSTNFESLLPKAYSEERKEHILHFCKREEGKLRALIDIYPGELYLGDSKIKTAYIGTVSVHPQARKKGYMCELMEEAERELRKQGVDLLMLDGSRHRYRNFGFERAGMKYCFHINRHGLHTYLRKQQKQLCDQFSFCLLEEEDKALVDSCYAYYQKRTVKVRNREDFLLCLKSWEADTYAIMENDTCVGYINLSADERNIHEVELKDADNLDLAIAAFMEELDLEELGVDIGADEQEKFMVLQQMADYYMVSMSHHIKILQYEKVLPFLLLWKSQYTQLAQQNYVIGIKNQDVLEKYRIQNNGITVDCVRDKSSAEPDVVFEEMELVSVLTTSRYYQEAQRNTSPLRFSPQGWFPLPFFLPEADAF